MIFNYRSLRMDRALSTGDASFTPKLLRIINLIGNGILEDVRLKVVEVKYDIVRQCVKNFNAATIYSNYDQGTLHMPRRIVTERDIS